MEEIASLRFALGRQAGKHHFAKTKPGESANGVKQSPRWIWRDRFGAKEAPRDYECLLLLSSKCCIVWLDSHGYASLHTGIVLFDCKHPGESMTD
jgi:hypothetical protein